MKKPINHENVIRISKGFMKEHLIPTYRLLSHYHRLEMKSLSSLSDFIYGKHLEINGKPVEDIWEILPLLKYGCSQFSFETPNKHQEKHHAMGTYDSICSIDIHIPSTCVNFENLHDYIYRRVFASKFPNAYLTSYDTAYRIGYNLSPQVLPENYVYLAAGAYLGAECLFGKGWIAQNEDKSFKYRKTGKFARVARNKFFYTKAGKKIDYFDGISSAEVEDMLCIFFDVKKY